MSNLEGTDIVIIQPQKQVLTNKHVYVSYDGLAKICGTNYDENNRHFYNHNKRNISKAFSELKRVWNENTNYTEICRVMQYNGITINSFDSLM